MSVLNELSSAVGRRDEIPNQELAARLAAKAQRQSISDDLDTLVENLRTGKRPIQHDCIKVLYEVGYLNPDLIGSYAAEFVSLLSSRDNRMVWGAMTALSAIAAQQPRALWAHAQQLMRATASGSAITQDHGIRVLAALAGADPEYAAVCWPYLVDFLRTCKPKDVARHAEAVAAAAGDVNPHQLRQILDDRLHDLNAAAAKRVAKITKQLS